jgi:hypothetical protein
MQIIDEDGRLFGVVNVIDALVLLLVLALLTVGTAFVLGGGGEDPDPTRTATLGFAGLTDGEVTTLIENDQYSLPRYPYELNVTDRIVTPDGDDARLYTRVQYTMTPGDDGLRLDRGALVASDSLVFNATVSRLDGGPELPTSESTVTVRTTPDPTVARAVAAGDTRTVAGRTLGTVAAVERVDGPGDSQTLRLNLTVETLQQGETDYYAGRPLRLGTRVRFATPEYSLEGTVVEL